MSEEGHAAEIALLRAQLSLPIAGIQTDPDTPGAVLVSRARYTLTSGRASKPDTTTSCEGSRAALDFKEICCDCPGEVPQPAAAHSAAEAATARKATLSPAAYTIWQRCKTGQTQSKLQALCNSLPHLAQQGTWLKHNAECGSSAAAYHIRHNRKRG